MGLRRHGRKTTWKTFLRAHWQVLGAVDFTTVELWTRDSLVMFHVLVAVRVSTHKV